MLSHCEAGGTSISSLGYRVYLEGAVGVGGQDVCRVSSKLHLSLFDGQVNDCDIIVTEYVKGLQLIMLMRRRTDVLNYLLNKLR